MPRWPSFPCMWNPSSRNHSPVVKIIVSHDLDLCLVSAAHVSVGNLLRLNVFVQFLLAILQTHCEISWPLGAPKEIEVIAATLGLIELRHGAEQPVLPLT